MVKKEIHWTYKMAVKILLTSKEEFKFNFHYHLLISGATDRSYEIFFAFLEDTPPQHVDTEKVGTKWLKTIYYLWEFSR